MQENDEHFTLFLGEDNIGEIKWTHDDQPFHYGEFVPNAHYESLRSLFEKECEFSERDLHKETYEISAAISRLGLTVKSENTLFTNIISHIEGDTVWWRGLIQSVSPNSSFQ